jgi:hypothetical protein
MIHMLSVSISGYFSNFNEFRIKEIFVSDENVVFVLKENESFIPRQYLGTVKELFDSTKNLYYPSYSMSEVRCYPNDNDAKSLANFLMQKIRELGTSAPGAHERLFDIISSFGEKCND